MSEADLSEEEQRRRAAASPSADTPPAPRPREALPAPRPVEGAGGQGSERPAPPAPKPTERPPAPRPAETGDEPEREESRGGVPAADDTGTGATTETGDAATERGDAQTVDAQKVDAQTPASDLSAVVAARQRRNEEARRKQRSRYRAIVHEVGEYVATGYRLVGLVGFARSGKTHSLKALNQLIGFEPTPGSKLRRERSPESTEADVFPHPHTGPWGRYVFVDAGGELYGRLRDNDWEHEEQTTGLLHALLHCQGVVVLVDLTEGHFDLGSGGLDQRATQEEQQYERRTEQAQREIDFIRVFLLFLRSLRHEGSAEKIAARCARAANAERALSRYELEADRLDIPVAVVFSKADQHVQGDLPMGRGRYLSPGRATAGSAALVARHLPALYDAVADHARRFKFDFAQSYVEVPETLADGSTEELPRWKGVDGDEPLSVGLLSAVEFVLRHQPPASAVGRLLRRFELGTRTALRLHRRLHPKLWRDVEDGRP